MDSHNSSKPPSLDGFKKKSKSLRSHSDKTSGGQPGHNGNNLKFESPDDIKHLPVDECARCKCPLKDQELSDEEIAQIIDILLPKLFVKEFRAAIKICPCCGVINKASFPSGIQAGTQYGAGVKSFMVYLNQYQHISYERACEIFRHSIIAPAWIE